MAIAIREAQDRPGVTVADVNRKFIWEVVSRIRRQGEVLVSQRVISPVEGRVAYQLLGDIALKGFQSAVPAFRVTALRAPEGVTS